MYNYTIELCMKQLTSFLLILLLASVADAQTETYNILFVKGIIKLQKTGTVIKPGDKILSTDKIIFQTGDAAAAIVSPSKGRFVLSSKSAVKQADGGLLAMVSSAIAPVQSQLSTRAGELITHIDLVNYFTKEPLVILEPTSVVISPANYPMNAQSFFFIRYQYKGETINKKIPYMDSLLLFYSASILTIDEMAVADTACHHMKLYYYSKTESKATEIGPVTLIFPHMDTLTKEMRASYLSLKNAQKSDADIQKELYHTFLEFYGKASQDSFDTFYKAVKSN